MSGNKNIAQRNSERELPSFGEIFFFSADFVIIPFRFGHPNIQEVRSLLSLSTFLNGGLRTGELVTSLIFQHKSRREGGGLEIRSIPKNIVMAVLQLGWNIYRNFSRRKSQWSLKLLSTVLLGKPLRNWLKRDFGAERYLLEMDLKVASAGARTGSEFQFFIRNSHGPAQCR